MISRFDQTRRKGRGFFSSLRRDGNREGKRTAQPFLQSQRDGFLSVTIVIDRQGLTGQITAKFPLVHRRFLGFFAFPHFCWPFDANASAKSLISPQQFALCVSVLRTPSLDPSTKLSPGFRIAELELARRIAWPGDRIQRSLGSGSLCAALLSWRGPASPSPARCAAHVRDHP
jgi:hypothetical protein